MISTFIRSTLRSAARQPGRWISSATDTSSDLLVIGSGVAGCTAALKAAELGRSVTLLTAHTDPEQCNSYWAQGGIIYKAHDDKPALLESDIHIAGAGRCKAEAVSKLAHEGPGCVEDFLLDGAAAEVPFDRSEDGSLALCLEASHNRARIIHWADQTGKAIMESMIAAVRKESNVRLVSGCTAVDLLLGKEGECVGARVLAPDSGSLIDMKANATVLATGGLGEVYEHTSNPPEARGDGVAMAARAGAALENMEFVQFHPTTLYIPGERRFLLTEALRGVGAKLRSATSDRRAFATDYHPDGELAPRDVVARMILSEMESSGSPYVFLDLSHHEDPSWVKNRFPAIYEHCLARGIDMTKDPMPVVPAAHYSCGGISVDLSGKTSIPRLYAAGEVACTGLHGANRLASTSLLEGLVWGNSAVVDAMTLENAVENLRPISVAQDLAKPSSDPAKLKDIHERIKQIMWASVGIVRQPSGLHTAIQELQHIYSNVESLFDQSRITPELIGTRNAAMVALQIAQAAASNKESVGTHHIITEDDEPQTALKFEHAKAPRARIHQ